jgi:hypothetical protein
MRDLIPQVLESNACDALRLNARIERGKLGFDRVLSQPAPSIVWMRACSLSWLASLQLHRRK